MQQLKRIGQTIASLTQCCDEMKKHISAAHQETAPVLEEASDLMLQKAQVESKQELLKALNSHFVMSDNDVATLTSTAEPISEAFFVVLARAKQIQLDCEILLGTENQRLGSEVMEQTSRNITGAFQKLYRWIQREFKSLNLENPQIGASMRKALRVLAERPSLFESCLDSFAEAREQILSDTFYTALTGNTPNGEQDPSVKPIELVAHDPLRYVGDMLAWIHSTTVSEREALEILFISEGDEIAKGIQAGRASEPWTRTSEDGEDAVVFDGLKALNDLVDRDVVGAAKILRQRIGQMIQSHEETIMAYQIANLLSFYKVTFVKLLGSESVVLETLESLEENALRQFRVLMRDHVAGLRTDGQTISTDLRPTDFLHESLKQLTAIMKTYETSFSSPDSREAGFKSVLDEAFEPFLRASADLAQDLPPRDKNIYTINYLTTSRNALLPFDFTTTRVNSLQEEIEEISNELIMSQYSFFRLNSGLQPLLQALAPLDATPEELEKVRKLDVFQPKNLIQASQTLDDFLPSALMDAMENIKTLQSATVAREITEEAAERFCEDFEQVEHKLIAADELWAASAHSEQEEPLRELFPRTSSEIRVLLS